MTSAIHVDRLTLDYQVGGQRRLVPTIGRRGVPRELAGDVGGSFAFKRRKTVVRSLDGISFSLSAGDRLGLIGSNGAGKSTLLMVLAGIFSPTAGTVSVQGRVDALFNINLGFRPEATGRRNIVLRGLMNGWTPARISEQMDSIIEFSGLGQFIDMPFKSYSQGMAARLAFSIATAIIPDILLLDEWIGTGDGEFQEKARDRMDRLVGSAGILVIASHDAALLRQVCTKVMRLEQGRIVAFGEPEELLPPGLEVGQAS